MRTILVTALMVLSSLILSQKALAFSNFEAEVQKVSNAVACKKPQKIKRGGMVFSCVGGEMQTVKVWVSEKKKTGKIKSVKFVWNDYIKDIGKGIHKDQAVAEVWLKAVLDLYAGGKGGDIQKIFWSNDDGEKKIGAYRFASTVTKTPAVVQRQLVIYPK